MQTSNELDLIPTQKLLQELGDRHDLVVIIAYRNVHPGTTAGDEFLIHHDGDYDVALALLQTAMQSIEKEQERQLNHNPNEGEDDEDTPA